MENNNFLKNNITAPTLACIYIAVLIALWDIGTILFYKREIFSRPWTPFIYPFFWTGFHIVAGFICGSLLGLLLYPVFRIPIFSKNKFFSSFFLISLAAVFLFLYGRPWAKLAFKSGHIVSSWLVYEGLSKYIIYFFITLTALAILVPLWKILLTPKITSFKTWRVIFKLNLVIIIIYIISFFTFIRSNTFIMPDFWSAKDSPFRKTDFNKTSPESFNYTNNHSITNVVLIVIDTLRADHMSLYGYRRKTTPFLEEYARQGIVFTKAYVQKTSTSPSVASILTGTYPHTHGIVGIREYLPEHVLTLGEILQRYGYSTASFVANSNLSSEFNFDQGFNITVDCASKEDLAGAKLVNDRVFPWLKEHSKEKFFLYVHYIDPHAPYSPPSPYNKTFMNDNYYGKLKHLRNKSVLLKKNPTDISYYDPDYFIAQYDGEILYTDAELNRLLKFIEDLGLTQNTLVVITADHGESLGDEQQYYFSHGYFGYEPTAHIPLIMKVPDIITKGKVIQEIVETIDIAPTILSFLNLPADKNMEGMSLLPYMVGEEKIGYPRAYLEADSTRDYLTNIIVDGDYKLICNLDWPHDFDFFNPLLCIDFEQRLHLWKKLWKLDPKLRSRKRWELYNLTNDPQEKVNLAMSQPQVFNELKEKLYNWMRRRPSFQNYKKGINTLSLKTLKNLKTLGYIQ